MSLKDKGSVNMTKRATYSYRFSSVCGYVVFPSEGKLFQDEVIMFIKKVYHLREVYYIVESSQACLSGLGVFHKSHYIALEKDTRQAILFMAKRGE